MQFVLLIYQGSTPTPNKKDAWGALPDDEKKKIYAEYAALNQTPGLKPGLPLGLPEKAATVRVEAGKAVVTEGPFLGAYGSVAGFSVFEAETLEAAVQLAAKIPAARLGGAVEVRPVETYW
jgi:hypothetical protein